MSSSDFIQLRRELSLLGIQVPHVVAVIEEKHRELIRGKNELWKEVEETTSERDTLKEELEEKEEEVSLINSEEMENEEKIALLEEENKKLKEERDFFHQEFHKNLQHQADDMEE